ncbi:hypothetical protein [Amycolatopsis sp. cmx-4-68]|uniref:hypothetical protein n=1 Tax=Amycolatopsis sp. cmx-4-68 TaxID=2790938 RepID=UPI00397E4B20
MGSTDPGGARPAVPVENTVRALRSLAPGATLRRPGSAELRELARVLRKTSPADLARTHPGVVASVVLAEQLRALDRATTGLFGPEVSGPEAARLVRAARYSGRWRPGELRDRLRSEPGLRAAALGWAEVTGRRALAAELRGAPVVPTSEDGRAAAEVVVGALLPRVEVGAGGREILVPQAGGELAEPGAAADGCEPAEPAAGGCEPPDLSPRAGGGGNPVEPAASASGCEPPEPPGPLLHPHSTEGSSPNSGVGTFLDVRSVQVSARGFRVDVHAAPPVEVVGGREGLTLRALWWNGLGRVTDDLGYEYLILAKDPDGTGIVRHWCHPRPAPGARVLRLESAGYRGELLRLDPAAPGTSAEVLVKLELTVRLGA